MCDYSYVKPSRMTSLEYIVVNR